MSICVILNGKKKLLTASQLFSDVNFKEFNENHDDKGKFSSGSGSSDSKSSGAGKGSKMDPSKVKLDPYEQFVFKDLTSKGHAPDYALNVMINSVEGDHSQLSPGLKSYAKSIGSKPY